MYFAMNSIYHVTLTFVGQNVGAKKFKNIRRITAYSSIIVVVVGVVSGGLLWLFKDPIIGLYVSSPESASAAVDRFIIIALTYYMCGLMEVFCGTLRALDRSITAMVISLTGACGLRILWIETMGKIFPYPSTIYLSYPVTWFITCAAELIFIIVICHKILKRQREAENGLLKS
jgi:Na+-driven multidrug efflux pump